MPINKERVGEERYREMKHDAYMRRRARLEQSADLAELKRLKDNPEAFEDSTTRSYLYLFYLGVKIGLELAFTDNRLKDLKDLTEEEKDKIELWPLDMAQRIIEDNWNSKLVQQRHVRSINAKPLLEDTRFYRIIARSLDEDEADVWNYVFQLLHDHDSTSERHTTAYIVEYETGIPQKKVYSTLQRLQELHVIEFRDDDSQPHLAHVQPIWLKRGTDWIDE